jgi:hypothetical protein
VANRQLLSPNDVADMLGVAPSTLAKWRQTGDPDLPYLQINGRIRYRPEDIQEFINEADGTPDDTDEDADEAEDDDDEDDDDEDDD